MEQEEVQRHVSALVQRDHLDAVADLQLAIDEQGITSDQLLTLLTAAGRNSAPWLLWYASPHIPDDVLRAVVLDVWASAEWPVQALGVRRWHQIFRRTGYVSDHGCALPKNQIALFRGAGSTRAVGMSWTSQLSIAVWFAWRSSSKESPGHVLRVVVAPEDVLACCHTGRQEAEVIIRPVGKWRQRVDLIESVAREHRPTRVPVRSTSLPCLSRQR